MKKEDENWLLSSISKAWNKVRMDAGNGYIWTERDTVSSLYRHLVPFVEKRNRDTSNNLGNLRVYTEVRIEPQDSKNKRESRSIDLAIATTSNSRIPQPSRIIVHFEFKFGWNYYSSTVKEGLIGDIKKIMTGNENWLIWGDEDCPAATDYVVLGLVANGWDNHTWSSPANPNNGGILHPNGEDDLPRIDDFREGLQYFELHGPFSTKQSSRDFILGKNNRWGFFEIDRDGQKRKIS